MSDSRRLSFADYDEHGAMRSAWGAVDKGEWNQDVKRGEVYAEELAEHIRETSNNALAVRVIRRASSRKDGVATGFLFRITEMMKVTLKIALIAFLTVNGEF